MGDQGVATGSDQGRMRAFMRAVLDDVEALERMLRDGRIESDVRRIGAEQEMFLVDQDAQPAPVALEVLKRLGHDSFTTELARFNLEANLSPQPFGGSCLRDMERELEGFLAAARAAAKQEGAEILLTGILPTLRKAHLGLDSMTPSPRYYALNEAMLQLRGAEFRFHIKGLDDLHEAHDNVMLEACNTSFQVHFQVGAEEFADLYNIAQVATAPVLAAAVNSPTLLGRRLWHETRVALFQQSVDARTEAEQSRGQRMRVTFGDNWVKDSVLEIFREDIARFRLMLASEHTESSLAQLDRDETPSLAALRMHSGTVYRWNRPCYGISAGKPHLRIENRVLPSGPTPLDEMANAAFFFGLLAALSDTYGDVTKVMSFDHAKANFMAAARYGLRAHFTWIKGLEYLADELIAGHLLPVARAGLKSHGIPEEDIERYLGVIQERVTSGQTGAQWALHSLENLAGRIGSEDCSRTLTAAMLERQKENRPVHEWKLAEPADGGLDWRASYRYVRQVMTSDLFTVHPEDVVDLAANVMDWEHVRHVPVEDDDGRLVGLVSHRAMLRLVARHKKSGEPEPIAVQEIMRADPVTVVADTPVLDAIALMREHGCSCLPVVDDQRRLVGIVTERDFIEVAAALLEERLREA